MEFLSTLFNNYESFCLKLLNPHESNYVVRTELNVTNVPHDYAEITPECTDYEEAVKNFISESSTIPTNHKLLIGHIWFIYGKNAHNKYSIYAYCSGNIFISSSIIFVISSYTIIDSPIPKYVFKIALKISVNVCISIFDEYASIIGLVERKIVRISSKMIFLQFRLGNAFINLLRYSVRISLSEFIFFPECWFTHFCF